MTAAGFVPPLPRVALVCDYAEEQWPSMDLLAAMLLDNLRCHHATSVQAVRVQPGFVRRLSRYRHPSRLAFNADRLFNRMFDYPRHLRRLRGDFDLFHLVDHSYSQLVHELPAGRTVVSCHDLDTFRSLLEPRSERRSAAFRVMTGRILSGFQMAGRVACGSAATRAELLHNRLLPAERVVVIPHGVAPIYAPAPDPSAEGEAAQMLGARRPGAIELLHVGSTIRRKRIDVLLRVFAAVRERYPEARLVRVGGRLRPAQSELARSLGLGRALIELPFLSSRTLAAVYRRAALLLCPSDAEGFGLPLLESMACGTPAVVSDIPALREVGDGAAHYAPAADIGAWTAVVAGLLEEARWRAADWQARRGAALECARKFSWRASAARTVELYRQLLR